MRGLSQIEYRLLLCSTKLSYVTSLTRFRWTDEGLRRAYLMLGTPRTGVGFLLRAACGILVWDLGDVLNGFEQGHTVVFVPGLRAGDVRGKPGRPG